MVIKVYLDRNRAYQNKASMKWRCLMSRRAFLIVGFQDSKKKRYKNREKKREKNKIQPNIYSIKCFDKGISDLKTHLDYSYHHARSLWNFEFSRWKKIRPNMYRISANSFRGNYSFLNLSLCTVTFAYSTYRCGNYSREETI